MDDLRVCFFGDSYTFGQGDQTGQSWPSRVAAAALADGYQLTAYNCGVRGDTVAEVVERLAPETRRRFAKGDRKALVFSVGANDVFTQRPLEESLGALGEGLAWAKGEGHAVFVLPVPPIPMPPYQAAAVALKDSMGEVCAARDVPFFDLHASSVDWDLWWKEAVDGDGIHPGAGAYASLAASFAAWGAWRGWLNGAA